MGFFDPSNPTKQPTGGTAQDWTQYYQANPANVGLAQTWLPWEASTPGWQTGQFGAQGTGFDQAFGGSPTNTQQQNWQAYFSTPNSTWGNSWSPQNVWNNEIGGTYQQSSPEFLGYNQANNLPLLPSGTGPSSGSAWQSYFNQGFNLPTGYSSPMDLPTAESWLPWSQSATHQASGQFGGEATGLYNALGGAAGGQQGDWQRFFTDPTNRMSPTDPFAQELASGDIGNFANIPEASGFNAANGLPVTPQQWQTYYQQNPSPNPDQVWGWGRSTSSWSPNAQALAATYPEASRTNTFPEWQNYYNDPNAADQLNATPFMNNILPAGWTFANQPGPGELLWNLEQNPNLQTKLDTPAATNPYQIPSGLSTINPTDVNMTMGQVDPNSLNALRGMGFSDSRLNQILQYYNQQGYSDQDIQNIMNPNYVGPPLGLTPMELNSHVLGGTPDNVTNPNGIPEIDWNLMPKNPLAPNSFEFGAPPGMEQPTFPNTVAPPSDIPTSQLELDQLANWLGQPGLAQNPSKLSSLENAGKGDAQEAAFALANNVPVSPQQWATDFAINGPSMMDPNLGVQANALGGFVTPASYFPGQQNTPEAQGLKAFDSGQMTLGATPVSDPFGDPALSASQGYGGGSPNPVPGSNLNIDPARANMFQPLLDAIQNNPQAQQWIEQNVLGFPFVELNSQGNATLDNMTAFYNSVLNRLYGQSNLPSNPDARPPISGPVPGQLKTDPLGAFETMFTDNALGTTPPTAQNHGFWPNQFTAGSNPGTNKVPNPQTGVSSSYYNNPMNTDPTLRALSYQALLNALKGSPMGGFINDNGTTPRTGHAFFDEDFSQNSAFGLDQLKQGYQDTRTGIPGIGAFGGPPAPGAVTPPSAPSLTPPPLPPRASFTPPTGPGWVTLGEPGGQYVYWNKNTNQMIPGPAGSFVGGYLNGGVAGGPAAQALGGLNPLLNIGGQSVGSLIAQGYNSIYPGGSLGGGGVPLGGLGPGISVFGGDAQIPAGEFINPGGAYFGLPVYNSSDPLLGYSSEPTFGVDPLQAPFATFQYTPVDYSAPMV